MGKTTKKLQLCLDLREPSNPGAFPFIEKKMPSNTVCLESFKKNRAKSLLLDQLAKSGLMAWKQAKIQRP